MFLLSTVLFAFWMMLSGKFDGFHLALGLLSSMGVAMATAKLGLLEPATQGWHFKTWRGWAAYLPWLVYQIFDSALQVAKVVLAPRMPIDPHLIEFDCALPHTVAHLTLANSITLTPGTVTLDHEGETYTIHALTVAAGASLTPPEGEGEMQRRVAELFQNSSVG